MYYVMRASAPSLHRESVYIYIMYKARYDGACPPSTTPETPFFSRKNELPQVYTYMYNTEMKYTMFTYSNYYI